MRTGKKLKTLENHREKNERTCQRTHAQNHAYATKSRRTHVSKLCTLLLKLYVLAMKKLGMLDNHGR